MLSNHSFNISLFSPNRLVFRGPNVPPAGPKQAPDQKAEPGVATPEQRAATLKKADEILKAPRRLTKEDFTNAGKEARKAAVDNVRTLMDKMKEKDFEEKGSEIDKQQAAVDLIQGLTAVAPAQFKGELQNVLVAAQKELAQARKAQEKAELDAKVNAEAEKVLAANPNYATGIYHDYRPLFFSVEGRQYRLPLNPGRGNGISTVYEDVTDKPEKQEGFLNAKDRKKDELTGPNKPNPFAYDYSLEGMKQNTFEYPAGSGVLYRLGTPATENGDEVWEAKKIGKLYRNEDGTINEGIAWGQLAGEMEVDEKGNIYRLDAEGNRKSSI